jgi:hypothetical protein
MAIGSELEGLSALDTSRKVVLYSDQKVLMYTGEAMKEGAVNDYLLHEMVRIRMDELRAEASRAHAAREARRSQGWRHFLGILSVSGTPPAEGGGFSRGTMEEACCA